MWQNQSSLYLIWIKMILNCVLWCFYVSFFLILQNKTDYNRYYKKHKKHVDMSLNIAKNEKKRVVIVGGGFGGLTLANKLKKSGFQVVLFDKNNYHQFPPLIYQVSSAGIEPSSISFPFRKNFQRRKNFFFRMGFHKSGKAEGMRCFQIFF